MLWNFHVVLFYNLFFCWKVYLFIHFMCLSWTPGACHNCCFYTWKFHIWVILRPMSLAFFLWSHFPGSVLVKELWIPDCIDSGSCWNFLGNILGLSRQSTHLGSELKHWAPWVFPVYACSRVSQDVWKFPHRIIGSPFQLSSLQDFLSSPNCSLAHRKLFLGFLSRKLDFSEFQLFMFSTIVQLQGWGHLEEKPYKRKKMRNIFILYCFSKSRLSFTICLLLFAFPSP